MKYDHEASEKKWQKRWQESKLDIVNVDRPQKPFYNLMMFPYPSAEGLHVGNMYAFTGSDIYGRFKRMQGYEVFEPIGLDGFGIHSENYALKIGRHPMDHAAVTQKNFYDQLHKIGAMFDWTRTVETYDTDYYRWTQWLFSQMFKHGLAYRGRAEVNFCPSCKTVLADEQVIEGACERCGNIVEKKSLEQWFFRITAYAEKLLENSFSLDWSGKVRVAQQNWIGKKEGIHVTYQVDGIDETVTVFTTAPVNFGMTFLVLAPEHDLVNRIISGEVKVPKENQQAITAYVKNALKKTPQDRIAEGKEKTGAFTGLYAINRINNKKVPIWVTDFVLGNVGTGAVQGCPGHDRKDFQFAKKFGLPIIRVIVGKDGDTTEITREEQVVEHGMHGHFVNSEFLNGLEFEEGLQKTMDYFEDHGWGKRVITYHLRDWLISRQRYWGPPIPMVFCRNCKADGKSWFTTDEAKHASENPKSQIPNPKQIQNSKSETTSLRFGAWNLELAAQSAGWYPVPDDQLPVVLPRIEDYKPGTDGIAPLAKHKEFYETKCSGCGGAAVRETDVSDTFLDSSWYFLRYPSVNANSKSQAPMTKQAQNSKSKKLEFGAWNLELPWDSGITRRWLPVHMYTGGAEHSVLHLMYSRFVTMALKDWGYIDFEEPFAKFYAHGLVIKDGAKMSKSKGNVVNPDEYIKLYGADALRLYLMFMGPFDQGGDFRDSAMEGMHRWVGRIWRLCESSATGKTRSSATVTSALHKLIKKMTDDLERRRYNTAIASMMEFTNLVSDEKGALGREDAGLFIKLLAPFAPHLSEELWFRLKAEDPRREASGEHWSVHRQPFPASDPKAIQEESVTMAIQVNGKLRESMAMPNAQCQMQNEVEKLARASARIRKYLSGQTVKKVIFVPGKIINFVL